MSRLRGDQSGLTVIELAVASFIALVVLGATLSVFEAMQREHVLNRDMNDAQQQARQGVDRLARQLRNLASPGDSITGSASTTQLPRSVERDLPFDLIFKEIDAGPATAPATNPANVRRVRYCLQTSGAVGATGRIASPRRAVLWMQTQSTSAALPALPADPPADPACPGATGGAGNWTTSRIVGDYLTNANAAAPRPLFRYSDDESEITATDGPSRERITRVEADVYVDPKPASRPGEALITTSVVLRNQNRPPSASFTLTNLNPVTCAIQLNGSASEDPENKRLTYRWFDAGVLLPATDDRVVVQASLAPGTHTLTLRVEDPAGLFSVSDPQTYVCS
jgi:hypothetical protein